MQVISIYDAPAGGVSLQLTSEELDELWNQFCSVTGLLLSTVVKDYIHLICGKQVIYLSWQ